MGQPYTIRSVSHDRSNQWDVYYYDIGGDVERLTVTATDELDAFKVGQQVLNKRKADMKTLIICATIAFIALLTSIVGGCKLNRDNFSANMATCIKEGKSYVSEDGSYSCRDVIVRRKTTG